MYRRNRLHRGFRGRHCESGTGFRHWLRNLSVQLPVYGRRGSLRDFARDQLRMQARGRAGVARI
jgi:hypothetical protein